MISVIVPVYNCAKYVARCIESILSQTYRDLELLIINDGSTDGSAAIIRQYAAKDSRIRYFEQENQGVSVARNRGIDEAKGEYILFVDGDDSIVADALAHLVVPMESRQLDIASYCCTRIFPEVGKKQIETHGKMPFLYRADTISEQKKAMTTCFRLYSFAVWLSLYRKDILQINHLRFFNGMIVAEDMYFAHLYSLFVHKGILLADFAGYNRYVLHDSCLRRNTDLWEHRVKQLFYGCIQLNAYMKNEHKEMLVGPLLAMLSWEAICHFAQNMQEFSKENMLDAKSLLKNSPEILDSIMRYGPVRRKIMSCVFQFSPYIFRRFIMKIAMR